MHCLACENGEEILLPENLVHQQPQAVLLVVIDGHEDYPVVGQQFPKKLEAGPHQAEPLIVPFQVVPVNHLIQPRLEVGVAHIVVVDPSLVAGVVGRIDIDAFDPSGESRKQSLEGVEVVAVDYEVIIGHRSNGRIIPPSTDIDSIYRTI